MTTMKEINGGKPFDRSDLTDAIRDFAGKNVSAEEAKSFIADHLPNVDLEIDDEWDDMTAKEFSGMLMPKLDNGGNAENPERDGKVDKAEWKAAGGKFEPEGYDDLPIDFFEAAKQNRKKDKLDPREFVDALLADNEGPFTKEQYDSDLKDIFGMDFDEVNQSGKKVGREELEDAMKELYAKNDWSRRSGISFKTFQEEFGG